MTLLTDQFGTGPAVSLRQHDQAPHGEAYYFDVRDGGQNISGVINGPGFEGALRALERWYPELKKPVRISADEINRLEFWLGVG